MMTRKSLLIAAAAVLAVAVPALAAHHGDGPGPDGPGAMMKDMTRADMEKMVAEHFAAVDANHDGAITMDEVKAHHADMRTEHVDDMFKRMDANGDGSISHDEFAAAHEHMGPESGPVRLRHRHGGHDHGDMATKMGERMFEKADANHDGKVTLAEAKTAALAHFDELDANHDGTVTAGERLDFWKTRKDEWRAKRSATAS